jgi:hypothetical protein
LAATGLFGARRTGGGVRLTMGLWTSAARSIAGGGGGVGSSTLFGTSGLAIGCAAGAIIGMGVGVGGGDGECRAAIHVASEPTTTPMATAVQARPARRGGSAATAGSE